MYRKIRTLAIKEINQDMYAMSYSLKLYKM